MHNNGTIDRGLNKEQLAFSRRSDSGVRREIRKSGKIGRKRGRGALTPYPTPSLLFSPHISSRCLHVGTP